MRLGMVTLVLVVVVERVLGVRGADWRCRASIYLQDCSTTSLLRLQVFNSVTNCLGLIEVVFGSPLGLTEKVGTWLFFCRRIRWSGCPSSVLRNWWRCSDQGCRIEGVAWEER